MCEIDVYPRGDGSGRKVARPRFCRDSRNGAACSNTTTYQHTTPAPIPIPRASHMPPSPRHTPGSSPRPAYSPRSSPRMDSPRISHHDSDSDASHRHLRPRVYVSQHAPNRETSHRRHRSYETHGSRGERIVIVEHPPTAQTPPQRHGIPRTAPSSPSPAHEMLRNRPVIVDERERPERRVRISVPPSPEASEGSSSSSGRRRRRDSEDRRREREQERNEAEDGARIRRREARIAQANRNISERPEQPLPPRRSNTTYYARPRVEIPSPGAGLGVAPADDIADGVWGMQIEDMDEDEEEAQKQRLKERMLPRRRATVSSGTRRTRVQLGDGRYVLE